MATFTVRIKTPRRSRPKDRADCVNERALIQELLLQIVSAVSNCDRYEGTASGHRGGSATFDYTAEAAAADA